MNKSVAHQVRPLRQLRRRSEFHRLVHQRCFSFRAVRGSDRQRRGSAQRACLQCADQLRRHEPDDDHHGSHREFRFHAYVANKYSISHRRKHRRTWDSPGDRRTDGHSRRHELDVQFLRSLRNYSDTGDHSGSGTFASPQSVTITDATSGAAMYYTMDGSQPTTSSSKYSGALHRQRVTTTVKAIAVANGSTPAPRLPPIIIHSSGGGAAPAQ